jgi:galactitol-specific phosphotransferase system IIB component
MAEKKLILCACGAGINTSKMAEMFIQDYLEKKKIHREYQLANCRVDTIESYRGRKNMVIVWMGAVDEKFGAPGVLGLPFMIGSKKDKEALTEKIIELRDGIYTP